MNSRFLERKIEILYQWCLNKMLSLRPKYKKTKTMKKQVLSAIAFGLGAGLLTAQVEEVDKTMFPIMTNAVKTYDNGDVFQGNSFYTRGGGSSPVISSFGDTIFAETFGDGLNGDPGNGSWSNTGSANWEYRGPATTPDVTVGSRGAYIGTRGPIQSLTPGNGFMIFDSDYLDNNGNPNTMGQGSNPTPHTGVLESPVMNFSNYTAIFLDMRSSFRRFQATCYIVFSTDGGATYTDTMHIYDSDFPVNSATADDARVLMPLPNSVPGNSQVRARIVFDGVTESNANGSGYYYWMIDDVYFVEAPENELELLDVYLGPNSRKRYYGNIPYRHARNDTMFVSGWLRNNGTNTQPNSRIDTYFNGVLENSSAGIPSIPGQTDSVANNGFIHMDKPSVPYLVDFVAASDLPSGLPENDTISINFSITDSIYSRSLNGFTRDNGNFYQGYDYAIGAQFPFPEPDTIKSVDIYFSRFTSQQNPSVIITVWDGNLNPVETMFTTITPNQVGNWANFDINDVPVPAGAQYVVGWEAVGDSVSWAQGQDGADPQTIFVRPENSNGNWFFTTTSNPKIRVNLSKSDCPPISGSVSNVQQAGCGLADGSATVTPNDSNNTILWPDNTTAPTNNSLAAGVYQVSLIDDNNCVGEVEVIIDNANAPVRQGSGVDVIQEISCNQANDPDGNLSNDGILEPQFTGGTPPYTYSWTGGSTTGDTVNSGRLEGLGAGSYRVTVVDANNCETFSQGFVTLVPPIQMLVNANHVTANPAGECTAVVTEGGEAPFTYEWNTGSTSESVTTDEPEPFTYEVTVTDDNGCVNDDNCQPVSSADLVLNEGIKVYPNPNSGVFNVEFTDVNGTYSIVMRNIVGQIVAQERVNVAGNNITTMNLDNLSSGLYLLEVADGKGNRAVHKLTVK